MNPPLVPNATALRQAAERRWGERPAARPPENEADLRRLQHELEVHQIELEMQNEQLRDAHDRLEAALERYTDLYEFAPVGYFTLDRDGRVLAANLTGARLLGVERAALVRRYLSLQLAEADRRAFCTFLNLAFTSGTRQSCEVTLARPGAAPIYVRIEAILAVDERECRLALIDRTQRHQADVERDELIAKLQHALAHVKQLTGLLPICASCKKIRDDRGYWNSVEGYIATHSEATFTHGWCPACAEKVLRQLDAEYPAKPPTAPAP